MTRNRERRSFTVAAKSSGHQGFVSIPAKAPRMPQAAARKPLATVSRATPAATPVATSATRADAEPRRVLPNLIAWEAPAPETRPDAMREAPLPKVRRVGPQGVAEDAPRRRGRPRKHPLPIEAPVPALRMSEAAPVPVAPRIEPSPPAQASAPRKARPPSEGLRLGERWKRRLPRACW